LAGVESLLSLRPADEIKGTAVDLRKNVAKKSSKKDLVN
jgi:hypothetical protein